MKIRDFKIVKLSIVYIPIILTQTSSVFPLVQFRWKHSESDSKKPTGTFRRWFTFSPWLGDTEINNMFSRKPSSVKHPVPTSLEITSNTLSLFSYYHTAKVTLTLRLSQPPLPAPSKENCCALKSVKEKEPSHRDKVYTHWLKKQKADDYLSFCRDKKEVQRSCFFLSSPKLLVSNKGLWDKLI